MGLTISEMVIAARMNGMSYGHYVQALSAGRAKLPPIKEIRAQLVQPKKRGQHSGPVNCYDFAGNFLAGYPSAAHAAEAMGVNVHTIRAACNGAMKSAYGYQWRYAGDEAPGPYKRSQPQTPIVRQKFTLECQRCGKLYKGLKQSRYCSRECADLVLREQQKAIHEKRKKPRTERVCPYCGKKFSAVGGKQVYCSKKCQQSYNRQLRRKKEDKK